MSTAGPLPLSTVTRSGPGYWLASLRSMTRFEMGRARQWAALMVLVQILMGAGMALMYGFFYPRISPETALYITTGTPVLALIPIGFVLVPASVGQEKTAGTFDFTWSLPVPRSAQAVATFLLFTVLSLPGAVLALAVASWRYGVRLDVSPLIVPGVLLSALMAISVGFGMALAISNPLLINLITNALVFVVLLFSPIVIPASHFPEWLLAVDQALPFYNMAEVIRAGLSVGLVTDLTRSYLILLAWTMAGWAMTAWVVGRRRLAGLRPRRCRRAGTGGPRSPGRRPGFDGGERPAHGAEHLDLVGVVHGRARAVRLVGEVQQARAGQVHHDVPGAVPLGAYDVHRAVAARVSFGGHCLQDVELGRPPARGDRGEQAGQRGDNSHDQ
jgi:ABC-2 type transport system permease protein